VNYRLSNDKFYITLDGIEGNVGTLREEAELIARQLSAQSNNILLSISSGIDSQIMLHSFATQELPYECSFLYSPGYNDTEFKRLKFLENKYGFKAIIVELDPMKLMEEIIFESKKYKIQRNQIYQKKYLSMLNEDYDFVQMHHSDFVLKYNGQNLFHQGYNSDIISRDRAFNLLHRKGKHIFFGENSRFLYSMLTDDVYTSALITSNYFNDNTDGYQRYDNYIKPLIYGKHWNTELEYYPKLSGIENIKYLRESTWWFEHIAYIPLQQMLKNMKLNKTVEYIENLHNPSRSRED
jgi:hypothetical protein